MPYLGLILLCIYQIIFVLVLFYVKKTTRKKLCDKNSMTSDEKKYIIASKIILFIMYIIILTNLFAFKSYLALQIVGVFLYIKGLCGFIVSVIEFDKNDKDELITTGPYKYSRNPQIMFIWTVFLSISLILSNLLILVLLVVHMLLMHQCVKIEENKCLEKYKNSYEKYLKVTSRYYPFKRSKF